MMTYFNVLLNKIKKKKNFVIHKQCIPKKFYFSMFIMPAVILSTLNIYKL